MANGIQTNIDIDQLMGRIRREIELSSKSHTPLPPLGNANGPSTSAVHAPALETQRQHSGPLPNLVTLRDYLKLHDEDFVRAAYRGLLQREPDPGGFENYLGSLRSGTAKLTILGCIRYSAEGKKTNVHVSGLGRAYALDRLFR
jgi:hypothetical protein